MPETYAEQIGRLKQELKRTIKRRNELLHVEPDNPWIGELNKDISDTRTVITQLEAAIREGHP